MSTTLDLRWKRTSLEQQHEQKQGEGIELDNSYDGDDQKKIDVDHVEVDMISDAEALLACRAFLQRKNRIGWEQAKERKELRKAQESTFLWDKPEQRKRRQLLDENDDDYDYYLDLDETTYGSSSGKVQTSSTSADQSKKVTYYDENQDDEDEYNNNDDRVDSIYTEMPTGPNQRSQIRSQVKKEQWDDPSFRERWYEARWGHHDTKRSFAAKKQKRMHSKLRQIPTTILQSPEFAKMTPNEIREAITSYVVSNRKRSRAQNENHAMKSQPMQQNEKLVKDDDQDEARPLARDSLYAVSEETLRERQQQRAVKAVHAYQKRVANAKQKAVTAKATTSATRKNNARTPTTIIAKGSAIPRAPWRPNGTSPKDALIRIVADLDTNCMPSLKDVQLIMEASKLSRRKDILRRILNEQFDIRGKAVPSNARSNVENNDDDDNIGGYKNNGEVPKDTIYVTQASISQLGKFVVGLMQSQM